MFIICPGNYGKPHKFLFAKSLRGRNHDIQVPGCGCLGLIALLLLSISSITNNVVHFSLMSKETQRKNALYYIFEHRIAIFISVACYIIGSLLVVNSVWHRLTTGLTNEHWSR